MAAPSTLSSVRPPEESSKTWRVRDSRSSSRPSPKSSTWSSTRCQWWGGRHSARWTDVFARPSHTTPRRCLGDAPAFSSEISASFLQSWTFQRLSSAEAGHWWLSGGAGRLCTPAAAFPVGSCGCEDMLSSCLSLLSNEGRSLIDVGIWMCSLGPINVLLGVHGGLHVWIMVTDQHPLLCNLRWLNRGLVFLLLLINE